MKRIPVKGITCALLFNFPFEISGLIIDFDDD